ncbi:MAG: hypothetical protein H7A25_18030 [Leptospiraceae bacterium]|nr:hypothetical protein [Leptospiraceae bacterium]MCP5501808.1 hypothetical protein [Leptospiraceae bacterium]
MIDLSSLLICGAFEGELDILSKFPSLNVVKTGIGSYESTFNLQYNLLRNRKINSVLFVGSAGAYPHSQIRTGELVYSNAFVYREIAEMKGLVKVPHKLGRNIITKKDDSLGPLLRHFRKASTNSTNYITVTDLELEECIDYLYDVEVENMEAFGLAFVAYKFSVPFTACYTITNLVSENGSNEWAANWREGSNRLQKAVLKLLFP